jgi:hypothetical protein
MMCTCRLLRSLVRPHLISSQNHFSLTYLMFPVPRVVPPLHFA